MDADTVEWLLAMAAVFAIGAISLVLVFSI
jgi:hypothetical protein